MQGRKMISESKLRELLHDNVPESSTLDFKRDLYRLDKKDGDDLRSKFIKDILSMANTPREQASYIVIGVTANPNGTKTLVGVPGDHPDDAKLQQTLNLAKVQPKPEFSYQAIRVDGLSYGVIEIPLQNHGPYIPTENYGVLRSSHVYFRSSSRSRLWIDMWVDRRSDSWVGCWTEYQTADRGTSLCSG